MPFDSFLFAALGATLFAAPPALPAPAAQGSRCPAGMKLVVGTHHEWVQRLCTKHQQHCWAFFPGLVALESRETAIRVCMDEYEWPNRKGAEPVVMHRFVEAEAQCASERKRLCTEFEWEKACEGPDVLPWPYGYAYEAARCNTARPYQAYSEKALQSEKREVRDAEVRRVWQGARSGSFPNCKSAYGVVDQVGNVEEWVSTSRPEWPHRSSLKGGFWSKPRSHCRGTNDSHGPTFRYYEIGFRCCADPK